MILLHGVVSATLSSELNVVQFFGNGAQTEGVRGGRIDDLRIARAPNTELNKLPV